MTIRKIFLAVTHAVTTIKDRWLATILSTASSLFTEIVKTFEFSLFPLFYLVNLVDQLLCCPSITIGHLPGDSHTQPMLITMNFFISSNFHCESCNKVRSHNLFTFNSWNWTQNLQINNSTFYPQEFFNLFTVRLFIKEFCFT